MKRRKLRKDLPPIDITMTEGTGLFGKKKMVPATKRQQRAMKAKLMEKYPDRYFIDDLHEWNSITKRDSLSWIDDIELIDAIMGDDFI